MKIENHYLNPVTPQNKPEGVQPSHKDAQPVHLNSKSATDISEEARLLSKARLSSSEAPAERVERVEELKQRVENGTYVIPFSDLAHRLLSLVKGPKE